MAAGISRDYSSLPMELPDSATRQTIKYDKRLAPYYSHLSRLVSRELTENVFLPARRLSLTPFMTLPFEAMRRHAEELKDYGALARHPQTLLVQKLVLDVFGRNYERKEYVDCLQALEETFRDNPTDLVDDAKRKLARFTDTFAERIETLVRSSSNSDIDPINNESVNCRVLPFIRYLWAGETSAPVSEPKHIELPVVEKKRVPRIQMIRQSLQRSYSAPQAVSVPRDPEIIRAPVVVAAG